jgi:hypothetical protein
MSLKFLSFVTFLLIIVTQSFSQRNYDEYNRIGITGGITFFDITTSDLKTKQGQGLAGGFTARGSFRNKFDLIYGIGFYGTKVEILAKKEIASTETEYVNYAINSVQIKILGSYNIVKHHLSLEFGPVLNVNSKLKLDSDQFEDYVLDGYSILKAKEIQDISPVNFHLLGGLTAGLKSFRLSVQYQYGVTNMLNKLNSNNLENTDFKGNSATIVVSAVVYI